MFHQRRIGVEALEDRTLLSGSSGVQQTIFGEVLILGDNADNRIDINQTMNLGVPTLTVQTFNGMTNETVDFLLSSINELDIVLGSGSNIIRMGNIGGFSIPGNINIDVGAPGSLGIDTVSLTNISTNAGIIRYDGTHGAGTASTYRFTNVLAGASLFTSGPAGATVDQTNVTLGFDFINLGANSSNNFVNITNSLFHPAPKLHAIGQLQLTEGNGNNNDFIDTIDVGSATITAGTGSNRLIFSHSTILQDDTTLGVPNTGAGNNLVIMNTDTVTGTHLNLNVFDESGLSGSGPVVQNVNNVSDDGGDGFRGERHINQVTLNSIKMTDVIATATPMLAVRMDDGDFYYNTHAGRILNPVRGGSGPFPAFTCGGSSFKATLDDLPGVASFTLGDHMQNVQIGDGAHDANDLDAAQLFLSAGNDLATVMVNADIVGQFIPSGILPEPFLLPATEVIQLGDNTINPVQAGGGGAGAQLPLPFANIWGTVGTPDIAGNMTLTIGSNLSVAGGLSVGEPLGWPVDLSETVLGSLFISPSPVAKSRASNGLAINVDSTSVTGLMEITMGNGGLNAFESLTLSGVTSTDPVILVNSNAGDTVNINLADVAATDPNGGLLIQDNGHGVDRVNMLNVALTGELVVILSDSGANVLTAQNVTAAFGFIDGGAAFGNVYVDNGGNAGYLVFNF